MPNTTTTPNMNLPVPVVGTDPGPDWANNLNASLNIVDQHNHTPGSGVQIPPSGLNINSDLPLNNNNAVTTRSIRFTPQASPIPATAPDLGCVYEAGADLYYNDGNGNQVRITQGGTVSGSSGTITGLPSGTASASYTAGTFTFDSATSTPATMSVGSVVVGREDMSGIGVTLQASGSQASNYNVTLPTALPGTTSIISMDSSGNLATITQTGTGSIVAQSSPTINSPTISNGTLNVPSINNATITSSTIDSSAIGSTTPSSGKFTSLISGGGGTAPSQAFSVAFFSGNIANNTGASMGSISGATAIIGAFGVFGNGSTRRVILPDGNIETGAVSFGNLSPSNLQIANNAVGTTVSYYAMVFYQ